MKEPELIDILFNAKKVMLIEPPYKTQYVPLGLAKIAGFLRANGIKYQFAREPIQDESFDLICVTTLFTNDSKYLINTINSIRSSFILSDKKVLIGGILASLMPEWVEENTGIKPFAGYSKILDSITPDYSHDWGVKSDFWRDCSTVFTQRGCSNKCGFCMVHKMEPEYSVCCGWKNGVNKELKTTVISDNNLLVAPIDHVEDVVKYMVDNKQQVIFNNGIDSRLATDENIELLSRLKYVRQGFRTAFDSMAYEKHFHKIMEMMKKHNINRSYTYVLFNYKDTPQDAFYRVSQAWKYKSNPYFMRYRPLDQLDRKGEYIGKHWTRNLVRMFLLYGHTYGYNRGDKDFVSWYKTQDKIKFTAEDLDKWNYKKGGL